MIDTEPAMHSGGIEAGRHGSRQIANVFERNVLYVTYDGLLDPLGQSQILPYLLKIRAFVPGLTVLSFEKPERMSAGGAAMQALLERESIGWKPLRFTHGGPGGKIWDLLRSHFWTVLLARRHQAGAIHARGHPAAGPAALAKRLTGAKFIFDFRGFWVDERVDKGGWDLSRPLDKLQFRQFKRSERKLLQGTDALVVLTEAAVPEVRRLGLAPKALTTVIPCCADFEHFPLATPQSRAAARTRLSMPEDALVIGYLGSVGAMYMLERFLRLFVLAGERDPRVHAVMVTQDCQAAERLIEREVPAALRSRIRVRAASRGEVPELLAAIDVMISFIVPSYARTGASPTKMAEAYATGLPVVCNPGVGDVAAQVAKLDGGVVVNPMSDDELLGVAKSLEAIRTKGGRRLRNAARPMLGLELAEARYRSVYAELSGTRC